MLKDLGVEYVIIGHSERRQYFAETNETVNLKIKAAFKNGLTPIVCVGESLELRDAGTYKEFIKEQVVKAFEGIDADKAELVVIAYEPIWAIGTGRTASSEQAEEVCEYIRSIICELYGKDTAETIRIQYGGSVNAGNCAELFGMKDIDGGLIGGASLKVKDFTIIAG